MPHRRPVQMRGLIRPIPENCNGFPVRELPREGNIARIRDARGGPTAHNEEGEVGIFVFPFLVVGESSLPSDPGIR
jgi:hypothetical protein